MLNNIYCVPDEKNIENTFKYIVYLSFMYVSFGEEKKDEIALIYSSMCGIFSLPDVHVHVPFSVAHMG